MILYKVRIRHIHTNIYIYIYQKKSIQKSKGENVMKVYKAKQH